jgi:hypothetical protein
MNNKMKAVEVLEYLYFYINQDSRVETDSTLSYIRDLIGAYLSSRAYLPRFHRDAMGKNSNPEILQEAQILLKELKEEKVVED